MELSWKFELLTVRLKQFSDSLIFIESNYFDPQIMFTQTRHNRLFSQLPSSQANDNLYKQAKRVKTLSSGVQPSHRFMKTNLHLRNRSNLLQNSKNINAQFHFQKIMLSSSQQTLQNNKQRAQNNPKNYKLKVLIGHGTFGKVFNAYSLKAGKQVAIKKIYQDAKYHNRQLQILKILNHPNIIKMLDYYYETQLNLRYLYIVMNLYDDDLNNLIKRGNIQCGLTKIYLYQILKGLEYLNSIGIAHRDLKPHNILVDSSKNQAVICDFGSAKKLSKLDNNVAYICARSYRAPELILGSANYTTAIDMWSFGCIAAELSNGRLLFQANSNIEQFVQIMRMLGTPTESEFLQMNPNIDIQSYVSIKKISKVPLRSILNNCDNGLVDLIEKTLVYSPSKRLTPTEALLHPYFQSLKNPTGQRYHQTFFGNLSSQMKNKKGSLIVKKAKLSSPEQTNQLNFQKLQRIIVPSIILKKQRKLPQIQH